MVFARAPHRIVVGLDESPGAAWALRWAVAEARLRRSEVTAVLAWGFLDQHRAEGPAHFEADYGAEEASATLRHLIGKAVGAEAAATVRGLAPCDLPARALLEASRSADLLVVGARGLGGFRGLLLGSVSEHCLHHTTVPITIVREHREAVTSGGRIVVGVDGSAAAQRGLRWAIEEARWRGAQLDVATAWQTPPTYGFAPDSAFDEATFEAEAKRLLDWAVATENTNGLAHPIRPIITQGGPAAVLLDCAADADLLVVASRGQGALKRGLIGSVASQVSQHATCPTVVVPDGSGGR